MADFVGERWFGLGRDPAAYAARLAGGSGLLLGRAYGPSDFFRYIGILS
jgi:hypothetical protein